ncbi:MAG: N-acetylmuramoyl-L-alanine amidase, partial [Planctomycetes bacterium]|nr:N-acetylmuramoyl-L-alanine amidase [Planctomycetota bacterium]
MAMTLGALALMGLETDPVRPMAEPLAVLAPPPAGAAESVYDTDRPIRRNRWRYVVVHAAGPQSAIARGCHFLVGPDGRGSWRVTATPHWRSQDAGSHVSGYWSGRSIGICVVGDFSRTAPPPGEFQALIELVQALQE